jgi:hypothetical protein
MTPLFYVSPSRSRFREELMHMREQWLGSRNITRVPRYERKNGRGPVRWRCGRDESLNLPRPRSA